MSVRSHPFVGRAREIQLLEAALEAATKGEGGTWLVRGEPGLGKSRLVDELAHRAEGAGLRVLRGRCWEAGGAPPFWPWLAVLRDLLCAGDGPAPPRGRLQVLSTLLPELEERHGPLPAPVELEPAQARFRVLDAVAETLVDAARAGPLVVILEDLHVADTPSLVLLDLVFSQAPRSGLLVVGTHRDVDDEEVRPLLQQLGRRANRLSLARLTVDEVRAFLEGSPGASPELAGRLHALTAGNPLFLVEMTALLRDAGGPLQTDLALPLPTELAGAIDARLAALTPKTRALLQLASVLGRELDPALLCGALELASRDVETALSEATAAQLVEPTDFGRVRFSHGLVQEALHQQLEPARREELHLRVAGWLGELPGAPRWSEMAHHYGHAGSEVRELAIEAAASAAETAMAQHAYGEAARQLRRALAYHGRLGAPDPAVRSDLQREMGRALLRDLQVDAGRAACREAIRLAEEAGDPQRLARAVLELGNVYVFAAVDPDLVSCLRRALEALGEAKSPFKPQVMARLAAALQPARDPTGPIELAIRAIELARELGDDEVLLATLRPAVSAMMDLLHAAKRGQYNELHLRMAEALGNRVETWRAHLRLIVDAGELGDAERMDRHLVAAQSVADELAHPSYVWPVLGLRAARAAIAGDAVAARQLSEEAARLCEVARDPNATSVVIQRIALARVLLRDDEALEALTAAGSGLQATAMGMVGELTRAGCLSRSGMDGDGARVSSEAVRWSIDVRDVPSLGAVAESIGRMTPAAPEVELVEQALRRETGRFASWGLWGMAFEGPADYWAGFLALVRGDMERAVLDLEHALELARSFGHRPAEATSAHALARALELRGKGGDLDRVAELRLQARTLVERHGLGSLPWLSGGETPTPATSAVRAVTIERDGESWVVAGDGRSVRLSDTKGIAILARLVAEPGREFHVLDLSGARGAGPADGGDAGELLDEQARESYRARVRELRAELEQAGEWNDPAREARAREELEAIETELARAVGLGGRARRAGSAAERARVNIQRRIKDGLRRISEQDEALGRRLSHDVSTGTYCRYDPA